MFVCKTCLVQATCKIACVNFMENIKKLTYDDIENNPKKILMLLKNNCLKTSQSFEFRKGNLLIKLTFTVLKVGLHWFSDGYAHREDGPAKIWCDGSEYHWLYDIFLWSVGHNGKEVLRINRRV
ncbi:MAG: hypothetical protein ACFFG0_01675 [Candidatus Thorarchaeota archaeon]